jgi:hypothetical protein
MNSVGGASGSAFFASSTCSVPLICGGPDQYELLKSLLGSSAVSSKSASRLPKAA